MPGTTQPALFAPAPVDRSLERRHWLDQPRAAFAEWIRIKIAGGGHHYDALSQSQLRSMWNVYVTWCETHDCAPLKPTPDHIARFLQDAPSGRPLKPDPHATLNAAGSGPTTPTMETRRRYAKLLSMTFKHMEWLNLLRGNPVDAVMPALKPEAAPAVSFLPKSAEQHLIEYANVLCDQPAWLSQRDGTLLLTLVGSGPTASEVVDLTCNDVVLDDYVASLNIAARGLTQAHAAPVPPFLLSRLAAWLKTRAADPHACDYLFPSLELGRGPDRMDQRMVYVIVRKALESIRFKGSARGPQTLRNTFARRNLFEGVDPAILQNQMGLATDRTLVKVRRTLPLTAASIASTPS